MDRSALITGLFFYQLMKTKRFLTLNSVDDGKVSGLNGKKSDWQGLILLPDKKLI
jgi:hypothetical protein